MFSYEFFNRQKLGTEYSFIWNNRLLLLASYFSSQVFPFSEKSFVLSKFDKFTKLAKLDLFSIFPNPLFTHFVTMLPTSIYHWK